MFVLISLRLLLLKYQSEGFLKGKFIKENLTFFSQERVESNEATNTRNRELSREFARRGAVCFHVMQYLREVNPLYQVSYHQFQQLYDSAIAHSER